MKKFKIPTIFRSITKCFTQRGFAFIEFKDSRGTKCNIQESSSGEENCIWLGAEDIGLKHFKAHEGWEDIVLIDTIQEHYVANNRMHLNQEQAEFLIPILKRFVKTGGL